MCMRDLLVALRQEGLAVTETKIRWAITSDKIARPRLDGSLRFVFGEQHMEQLRRLFATKVQEAERC